MMKNMRMRMRMMKNMTYDDDHECFRFDTYPRYTYIEFQ